MSEWNELQPGEPKMFKFRLAVAGLLVLAVCALSVWHANAVKLAMLADRVAPVDVAIAGPIAVIFTFIAYGLVAGAIWWGLFSVVDKVSAQSLERGDP